MSLSLTEMSKVMKRIDPAFEELCRTRETLLSVNKEFDRQVEELRSTCDHPLLIEHDYIPSDFGSARPPMRKCQICGLREEGWGCGYEDLRTQSEWYSKDEPPEHIKLRHVVVVSEDAFHKFRVGQEPIV